ncbi:MAG: hypothetical protein JW863_08255 [Chitinispirillaceae bacterium]|nr:hypothetical protein [Chitinispirillaceae bacterium]
MINKEVKQGYSREPAGPALFFSLKNGQQNITIADREDTYSALPGD